MSGVGTAERPLRVAVVGAGPSGFYAAAALFASPLAVRVDLIDRLPTPFGLVRGGVAPDHQNIKAVIRAYDKTAAHEHFRFLGHVDVGTDVTLPGLLEAYDQVVLAVGCEQANPLGIPGEELPGSHSATEFVGWYNGHPDHRHRAFDLSARAAVVVGVGNVSMDVTRILVADPDELAKTDIADHALAVLRQSKVTDVYVLGRRGAAQAAFSPAEIKEIAELPGVDLVVSSDDVILDPTSAAYVEHADKTVKQNVSFLREVAGRTTTKAKRVHLRLLTSPIAIRGTDRVEAVEVGRNELVDRNGKQEAHDTGLREVLKAGLVFRAVGYRGSPLRDCPFDQRSGTIPNEGGRVRGAEGIVPRLYVVGWAKRGPQGLIGTNRADSKDTVERMLEDVGGLDPAPRTALELPRAVSWSDWGTIDRAEVARGVERSKLREKYVDVAEMLAVLGRS
jgi:ferredoxin--NADP+ reductase